MASRRVVLFPRSGSSGDSYHGHVKVSTSRQALLGAMLTNCIQLRKI